jgi:hypothetical protein
VTGATGATLTLSGANTGAVNAGTGGPIPWPALPPGATRSRHRSVVIRSVPPASQ